ncbi:putative hydrolase YxeP [compost metagenome]
MTRKNLKLAAIGLATSATWLSLAPSAHALEAPVLADIQSRVSAIETRMIGWRRDIHQHPELSNQEHRTARLVAEHLRSLGLKVSENVGGTGVVGILEGSQPGRVVALRADMDALPIKELTNLPYASEARGMHMGKEVDVMHACGHDGHTAILMATAEVLAGMREQIQGTVKFIFQPAEEGHSEEPHDEHAHIGAQAMIDAGVLKNPQVDAIFGLHLIPAFPTGTVAYRSGPILASGDAFALKVTGKQTHGGFPWNGIDPIVSSAQIIMGMQTIVSRQLNLSREPAVISIGSIHGGNRENIIPESVELLGTVRTFDDGMRDETLKRMQVTAESIAQASGAQAQIKFLKPGYATTVNDVSLTEQMAPTLRQVTGDKAVIAPKLSASEDFSAYQKKVPGLFFFLGSTDPQRDPKTAAPNHSPYFEIDEAALAVGARSLAALALDYLEQSKR